MMQQITGEPPTMWGTSIIGFGTYHNRYPSGHEGDAPTRTRARARARARNRSSRQR